MQPQFARGIQQQDTVVNVSNTSRIVGGVKGDIVNIDTVISLDYPEAQEITLVLPTITGDAEKAYLRTLDEIEIKQEFQPPVDAELLDVIPEEKRKELEQLTEIARQAWSQANEEAKKFSPATIKVDAGSQELKFFMQKEIAPIQTAEGEIFELSFIAPQSNFSVTEGRFTMSVIIILPKGATLYGEPLAVSPDGVPAPVLESTGKVGNVDRHVLQYSMQYDPVFTIRYKY